MHVTVIKVGGSLFDLPDLGARLSDLLAQLNDSRPLLISGGGSAADLVRDWDRTHHLSETKAHWLAIQSLMLNDRLLSTILPDASLVSSQSEAIAVWNEGGIPVLCSYDYLTQNSSSDFADLPASWDVTSDSIAAWVSLTWPATELILLKSVDLAQEKTVPELAEAGFVDAYLPTLADSLPCLRWCNLRADSEPTQLATVTSGSSFQSKNATGPA
ncbi:hypothetical protein [uncultured Gimesia sp.]|uniref:amino acid kinase family protein n=1 Tax=uncultured Gimesia sp. TaxID=1678688 RepID=UPI0030DBB3E5|tara:strand:+ start:402025 stop:402669 length:645 start_codon:yes stop_codon:yes gene_type:complete